MGDYIEQVKAWIQANEQKASVIASFVVGLILGALLF